MSGLSQGRETRSVRHPFAVARDDYDEALRRGERIGQERDALRAVGDALQSEASRLAEWATEVEQAMTTDLPYEAHMALLGVRSAIDNWTEVRHRGV